MMLHIYTSQSNFPLHIKFLHLMVFIDIARTRFWSRTLQQGLSSNQGKTKVKIRMLHTYIYLFGVLRHFQHFTGHITMGSWKGRGNQYIQFARVVYCKLPTNGKQLPAFPLKAVTGIEPRPQRWEARVLPLCHRGPLHTYTPQPMSLPSFNFLTHMASEK